MVRHDEADLRAEPPALVLPEQVEQAVIGPGDEHGASLRLRDGGEPPHVEGLTDRREECVLKVSQGGLRGKPQLHAQVGRPGTGARTVLLQPAQFDPSLEQEAVYGLDRPGLVRTGREQPDHGRRHRGGLDLGGRHEQFGHGGTSRWQWRVGGR